MNHKLYLKLPSRIVAIFAKICALFVFALYVGFIFKKMWKTFVPDDNLSRALGERASSEDIYNSWLFNIDYNFEFDSPYHIQENISKKQGPRFIVDEIWFLRRNSSDACSWQYSDVEFGNVQFCLWTTNMYSSGTTFTKIDTGIKNIRANHTFMRNLEETYFPLNFTCTLFKDYRTISSLIKKKKVVLGNDYFMGEY